MKNLAEIEANLLAVARAIPPSDKVPYAFEKRIMAHIQSGAARVGLDPLALWNRWVWRAAAPCFAVMLTLTVFNFLAEKPLEPMVDLNQRMESVLLADLERSVNWSN